MIVYRWEHKENGYGPLCGYAGEYGWEWYDVFKDHKAPDEFEVYREYQYNSSNASYLERHFFAWDCLDKLLDNIKEDKEETLESCGFVLMAYEVTENFCHMPDGQVFFLRESAKRIE